MTDSPVTVRPHSHRAPAEPWRASGLRDAASRQRAHPETLVQHGDDLVDGGGGIQLKERRLLEREELAQAALREVLFRFAGLRRRQRGPHSILAIDLRKLHVGIEVLEILREERGDGDRLERLAVTLAEK